MSCYVGKDVCDNFSITDQNKNLITGLHNSDFTYHLFDPSGDDVSSSINVDVKELGFGHYRINFVPDKEGSWYLVVYHVTFFPWGKAGSFCVELQKSNQEILEEILEEIKNLKIKRNRVKP